MTNLNNESKTPQNINLVLIVVTSRHELEASLTQVLGTCEIITLIKLFSPTSLYTLSSIIIFISSTRSNLDYKKENDIHLYLAFLKLLLYLNGLSDFYLTLKCFFSQYYIVETFDVSKALCMIY